MQGRTAAEGIVAYGGDALFDFDIEYLLQVFRPGFIRTIIVHRAATDDSQGTAGRRIAPCQAITARTGLGDREIDIIAYLDIGLFGHQNRIFRCLERAALQQYLTDIRAFILHAGRYLLYGIAGFRQHARCAAHIQRDIAAHRRTCIQHDSRTLGIHTGMGRRTGGVFGVGGLDIGIIEANTAGTDIESDIAVAAALYHPSGIARRIDSSSFGSGSMGGYQRRGMHMDKRRIGRVGSLHLVVGILCIATYGAKRLTVGSRSYQQPVGFDAVFIGVDSTIYIYARAMRDPYRVSRAPVIDIGSILDRMAAGITNAVDGDGILTGIDRHTLCDDEMGIVTGICSGIDILQIRTRHQHHILQLGLLRYRSIVIHPTPCRRRLYYQRAMRNVNHTHIRRARQGMAVEVEGQRTGIVRHIRRTQPKGRSQRNIGLQLNDITRLGILKSRRQLRGRLHRDNGSRRTTANRQTGSQQ